jgi:hypothetical protein
LDQILGRNCRFLQGPETDPKSVERIRKAIDQGNDMSVCLLNYRVDGTTFWNQFFIAALRDQNGNVTNFVGVQCKGKYSRTGSSILIISLFSSHTRFPLSLSLSRLSLQFPISTPVSPLRKGFHASTFLNETTHLHLFPILASVIKQQEEEEAAEAADAE